MDDADGRAVLRRRVIEIVRSVEAARAGHVLRNERRLARNESAKMPCRQPGVDVETSSNVKSDDDVDGLAPEERFGRLRLCGPGDGDRGQRDQECRARSRDRSIIDTFWLVTKGSLAACAR